MVEEHTKKDIEKISHEILKASNSFDRFPTPINTIISYSDLAVVSHIDLSNVPEGFFETWTESPKNNFTNIMGSIRGMLHRPEKIIYLDHSMSESRKSFVKLHEVGHDVLYWQHEILCCLDDDQTLDADVHEEFEEEANYFASVTLFQHDRFDSEMGKYELGINASLSTAKHFGASLHATLRRYVERSDKRCALLILENITPNGELPKCRVRNFLTSVKFEYEFGIIEWNETLGYKWPFVQLYYHKKRGVLTGHVELRTANGPIPFEFQFFNNSYNAFVLIFPVGENREIRNNIIFLPFA